MRAGCTIIAESIGYTCFAAAFVHVLEVGEIVSAYVRSWLPEVVLSENHQALSCFVCGAAALDLMLDNLKQHPALPFRVLDFVTNEMGPVSEDCHEC